MEYTLQVDNIKCAGCINSIKSSLKSIQGVVDVDVEPDKETIHVNGPENIHQIIREKLESLGYPELGHNSLLNKAKSYLSCAMGKMKD